MEIRKANLEDIELLIKNRMEFICLLSGDYPENFESATREYMAAHMKNETLLCYIAIESGEILSSAMMSVYDTLPTMKSPGGRHGYLYNVYTKESYRRQGLSTKVLSAIFAEAEQLGVDKVVLDYTDDGLKLYETLGFQRPERHLEFHIRHAYQ